MHSNRWRITARTAVLAVLLVAAGCTGTEELTATQETLTLEVQLSNTETRFESAYFQVVQLSLRPMDPLADGALDADGLGVVRFVLGVSYRDAGPQTASVSLREGVYQVTSLVLGSFQYNDLDPLNPPTSTATCQEYVRLWNLADPNPKNFAFTDFGRDVFVTVRSGQETKLTLAVDGEALEDAFLYSWLCIPAPICQTAPWCLATFRPDVFVAQGLDFFELQ
jgi:hypothetical protein